MNKYDLNKQFLVDAKQPIYRYLSFFQLVDILEKKKLYLKKICYWDDPSEGNGYVSLQQDRVISLFEGSDETVKDKVIKDGFINFAKSTYPFGTSWSLLKESDAMWRIYSKDTMGVQVQTSAEKLENALSTIEFPEEYLDIEHLFDFNYAVGKIDYTLPKIDNLKELEHFLIKKEAFKHEEEIRGLIKFNSSTLYSSDIAENMKIQAFYSGSAPTVILKQPLEEITKVYISINDDFIDAIKIDPRANDWAVETIKNYCKGKNITNVEQSNLYDK